MTKEQEKAIKVLEQYKHECIEEYKVELDDKKYTDEQHASYLHQQIEAVHIVLSMLKEKDKLINEQLKENVSLQKELNEENKRCMILANNDKFKEQIIDLMAEEIAFYQDINSYEDIKTYKKQIKQYFERRVKNG